MKFWPVIVALVGTVSGYAVLKNDVAQAGKQMEQYETKQDKLYEEVTEIGKSQAKQEAVTAAIYEAVKDLKGKR